MQVFVVAPPVRQPVDQVRIAVIGKDDWFISGEEAVEVSVTQPVRVCVAWL